MKNVVPALQAAITAESLTDLFGDNPVSWLNWIIVLGILVLSFYLLVFKLWTKINYFFSLERKIKRAQALGHTVQARLLRSTRVRLRDEQHGGHRYSYQGWYAYDIDGVHYEKRIPMHTFMPPQTLRLFWLNSPRHVFHARTQLWRQPLGCLYLFLILASFAIAGAAGIWLGVISV